MMVRDLVAHRFLPVLLQDLSIVATDRPSYPWLIDRAACIVLSGHFCESSSKDVRLLFRCHCRLPWNSSFDDEGVFRGASGLSRHWWFAPVSLSFSRRL